MRTYCTLFDHNYAAKAGVMLRSLARWDPGAHVYVLAIGDDARRATEVVRETWKLPPDFVRFVRLNDVYGMIPDLEGRLASRDVAERCWTMASQLTVWTLCDLVARNEGDRNDCVVYLDADLRFFGDPFRLHAMLDATLGSVGIVPHAFAPDRAHMEATSGRYNVAWAAFRRDRVGWEAAKWWAARCRERCDRSICGDQRYLDEFPRRWPGKVVDLDGPGIGLAPWNTYARALGRNADGTPTADGQEVAYYHFHELTRDLAATGGFRLTLGYALRKEDVAAFYVPYMAEYLEVEEAIKGVCECPGLAT